MSDECDKHKGYSFGCSIERPLPEEPLTIAGIEGYETYVINDNTIGIQPKWISIEDRLPEKHGYYLVLTRNEKTKELKHEILEFKGNPGVVLYWMPLPKLPEEK